MMSAPIGVLLMAYGTPAALEDIPAFLTHITGGRPAPEAVAGLVRRYQAIGGRSPLGDITAAQAQALELRLNRLRSGAGSASFRVYTGMRHSPPFITDAIAQMVADGVKHATAIAMAPHYSRAGAGAYIASAQEALTRAGRPFTLRTVPHWHMHPLLIEALAARVRAVFARLPGKRRQALLFTAHSLPEREVASGDPYVNQLQATCAAVAARAGQDSFHLAFQSAGRSAEPWLGPTVQAALLQLRDHGAGEVVICPAGFVTDHLETLYDIDVVLRDQATAAGMAFARTESLNACPELIEILADLVGYETGSV